MAGLPNLQDLDRHEAFLLLSHREPDPIAAAEPRTVQPLPRVRVDRHRLHLVHEAGYRVVLHQHQGVAAPSLVHAGNSIQSPPREGRPVAAPDAGREAGEQQDEQRGNCKAPTDGRDPDVRGVPRRRGRDRGYSGSSRGGILPATCSGVSTQVPPQPSLNVAIAAR